MATARREQHAAAGGFAAVAGAAGGLAAAAGGAVAGGFAAAAGAAGGAAGGLAGGSRRGRSGGRRGRRCRRRGSGRLGSGSGRGRGEALALSRRYRRWRAASRFRDMGFGRKASGLDSSAIHFSASSLGKDSRLSSDGFAPLIRVTLPDTLSGPIEQFEIGERQLLGREIDVAVERDLADDRGVEGRWLLPAGPHQAADEVGQPAGRDGELALHVGIDGDAADMAVEAQGAAGDRELERHVVALVRRRADFGRQRQRRAVHRRRSLEAERALEGPDRRQELDLLSLDRLAGLGIGVAERSSRILRVPIARCRPLLGAPAGWAPPAPGLNSQFGRPSASVSRTMLGR